jgi:hypothetical protein
MYVREDAGRKCEQSHQMSMCGGAFGEMQAATVEARKEMHLMIFSPRNLLEAARLCCRREVFSLLSVDWPSLCSGQKIKEELCEDEALQDGDGGAETF